MKLAIDIISTAQAMNNHGINVGASGNVSARTKTGMLITPSGMDYTQLTPDDIVAMDFDTTWFATANLRPSSEWRLHLDILSRRPDVNAIVHTHSTHATALATHGRAIPAFHYLVAAAGGDDIPCAAYAPFASPQLSETVLTALNDRNACLMAHHGAVAVGSSLGAALRLAVQVEELAKQYLAALTLGDPPLLPTAEMEATGARMARMERLEEERGEGDIPEATVLRLDR